MIREFLKRGQIRLTPDLYQELRQEILKRDGWRCQFCGQASDLQIHHLEFRSNQGNDTQQNLITLCANCHLAIHRSRSGESTEPM